jgi:hypothetical protein
MTSEAAWSLKTHMRKLWADHVIWTREYLVAAIAATQDAQTAAGCLLKNQEHLGNAIPADLKEPFCFYLVALDGTYSKEPIWFDYREVEPMASSIPTRH